MSTQKNIGGKQLRVRRGRVDSVDLYEVKEHELEILGNGESTGIYLNFAIFLLSVALTGISALCTATFTKDLIQNTFLFLSIIGILGGGFLIILWWRGRVSIKTIITKIKDRISPELLEDEFCEESTNSSSDVCEEPTTPSDDVSEDDTEPKE